MIINIALVHAAVKNAEFAGFDGLGALACARLITAHSMGDYPMLCAHANELNNRLIAWQPMHTLGKAMRQHALEVLTAELG